MSVAITDHEIHTQVTDTSTSSTAKGQQPFWAPAYLGLLAALQLMTRQSEALQQRKSNDAVHFLIVASVIVLLALGATVIIGAIAMCAAQGGVYDAMVAVDPWTFEITCHKI